MSTISLQDLQRDASLLIERIEAGESLEVTRGGRAVAVIQPVASPPSVPRPIGLCAGEFTVPDDFDAPLTDDMLREFEGS